MKHTQKHHDNTRRTQEQDKGYTERNRHNNRKTKQQHSIQNKLTDQRKHTKHEAHETHESTLNNDDNNKTQIQRTYKVN